MNFCCYRCVLDNIKRKRSKCWEECRYLQGKAGRQAKAPAIHTYNRHHNHCLLFEESKTNNSRSKHNFVIYFGSELEKILALLLLCAIGAQLLEICLFAGARLHFKCLYVYVCVLCCAFHHWKCHLNSIFCCLFAASFLLFISNCLPTHSHTHTCRHSHIHTQIETCLSLLSLRLAAGYC